MTTEYKFNTLIEWTAEDRAKGGCPVPDGSKVTVWLNDGRPFISKAETFNWGYQSGDVWQVHEQITAYLIHSVPREPIVRHLIVGGTCNDLVYECENDAADIAKKSGGRVVKMVEEME